MINQFSGILGKARTTPYYNKQNNCLQISIKLDPETTFPYQDKPEKADFSMGRSNVQARYVD